MEARLLKACRRYVWMQTDRKSSRDIEMQRGIIRGMATQLILFCGPWNKSERDMIVALEKEFMAKARG